MNRLRLSVSILAFFATFGATHEGFAQATKPAPSADAKGVLAAERAIWEAIKRADWAAFDKALSGMTYVNPGGMVVWQTGMSKDLRGLKLTSYSWNDVQTRALTSDMVLLTYKATADQTLNGKKTPSPMYMMSLWQKQGGRWVSVAHSETPATVTR